MKALNCKCCGATGVIIRDGFVICEYCDARYLLTAEDYGFADPLNNGISLESDIERLLMKCRTDPRNARKYANLILDIDPDNEDALKYLKR